MFLEITPSSIITSFILGAAFVVFALGVAVFIVSLHEGNGEAVGFILLLFIVIIAGGFILNQSVGVSLSIV